MKGREQLPMGCYLIVNPVYETKIWGEVNILRYLVRILSHIKPETGLYPEEALDTTRGALLLDMDSTLDAIERRLGLGSNPKSLNESLHHFEAILKSGGHFLGADSLSVCDFALYGALAKVVEGKASHGLPPTLGSFFKRMGTLLKGDHI
jgi:glutathione S-transferase